MLSVFTTGSLAWSPCRWDNVTAFTGAADTPYTGFGCGLPGVSAPGGPLNLRKPPGEDLNLHSADTNPRPISKLPGESAAPTTARIGSLFSGTTYAGLVFSAPSHGGLVTGGLVSPHRRIPFHSPILHTAWRLSRLF